LRIGESREERREVVDPAQGHIGRPRGGERKTGHGIKRAPSGVCATNVKRGRGGGKWEAGESESGKNHIRRGILQGVYEED